MNERSFRVYISCTKFNDDYYICDYYDVSLSDNRKLCFGTEDFSAERLRSAVKKYAVRVYNGKVSNGVVARHYTDLTPYYVMASINAPVSSLRLWVSAFYPNFARFERCDCVIPCGWVFYHGWLTPDTLEDTAEDTAEDTKDTTEDTKDTTEDTKDTTEDTKDTTEDTTIIILGESRSVRVKKSVVKPVPFSSSFLEIRTGGEYPFKIVLPDGSEIWDCRSRSYNEYLSDLIGAPPYDELPF